MDMNKKPWPLATLCGIRERIDTNPDFQRPPVWTKAQKQFLVDTILRNLDIPKLYWQKTGSRPDKYAVIDGQQRLRAIWEFYCGEYAQPKDAEPVNGLDIAGLKYKDLPDVIILDILMPKLNGLDVLKKLREKPASKWQPVIIVSALGDLENMKKGYNLEADYYIAKPCEMGVILKGIEIMLHLIQGFHPPTPLISP